MGEKNLTGDGDSNLELAKNSNSGNKTGKYGQQ